MPVWLLLFVGGGLGSCCRYALFLAYNDGRFPWGTFGANIAASFILGIITAHYIAQPDTAMSYRLLIGAGFCGGLSTFSTFVLEIYQMTQQQNWAWALGYIAFSLVIGVVALGIGIALYSSLK